MVSEIVIGVGVIAPMIVASGQSRGVGTVFAMSNNADKKQAIAFKRLGNGSFVEQNKFDNRGPGSRRVNDPLEWQGSLTFERHCAANANY